MRPAMVNRPHDQALDLDYGTPLGLCAEKSPGVFVREWSNTDVTVDCNSYSSSIKLKA